MAVNGSMNMAGSVIFEERVEVPLDLRTLAEFRRWALSDDFPSQGRIDYLQGRIEVDMSPENLFGHGIPKVELIRVLAQRVKDDRVGLLFADRTRVSCQEAGLSAEPDLVVVRGESLDAGRVRLVPAASDAPGQFVELEGGPDLVVEIVSDGSVAKDTRRLPESYFAAGVREFWLVDARGHEMSFKIHERGATEFVTVAADPEGFQRSQVLAAHYRLRRSADSRGFWTYDLDQRP